MAKRFTDTEKWKDVWYTDLSNDNKIIWQYLLDTCDESGILKLNLRLLNFNCSTNITVEDFTSIFQNRVTLVNKEYWVINKFCYFQYGPDFLTSKNKVVIKAIGKLLQLGLIKEINGAYTLSIPYQYPIDTPQEEEQIEEQIEIKEKIEEEVQVQEQIEEQVKNKNKDIDTILHQNTGAVLNGFNLKKKIKELILNDCSKHFPTDSNWLFIWIDRSDYISIKRRIKDITPEQMELFIWCRDIDVTKDYSTEELPELLVQYVK